MATIEARFTTRALRNTAPLRRRLTPEVLLAAVGALLPNGKEFSFHIHLVYMVSDLFSCMDLQTTLLISFFSQRFAR